MSAQVGGAYAALMGKKNKGSQNNQGGSAKPKAAKVISLKDTKDKPVPKAQKKEEPKTQPKKEKEPEKALTKREEKDARNANDRHVPRSGHAPGHGKKTDEVQDAVEAANQSPTDPAKKVDDAWKKERDERIAQEAAEREEEAKRITYAEYEKQLVEKKKELGVKELVARKVTEPKFQKLTKEDEEQFTVSKKKADEQSKRAEKKGKTTDEAPKKKKFVKSSTVELSFTVAQPNRERGQRGDRRGPRPPRDAAPAPAAPVVEAAAPAEAAPAEETA